MEENNKSPLQKYQTSWNFVEEALSEGTASGHKVAVLETEKILSVALNDKKFPGNNIREQIKSAEIILRNPEKLNYARAMYDKLVKEPGFDLSAEDAKEIISGYYMAISDIVKMSSKGISFKEKLNLLFQRHFYQFPRKIKMFLALIFIFFLVVFISTETSAGRSISAAIVGFSQFLFYKVLLVILIIAIVAALIMVALYYWQNRRR